MAPEVGHDARLDAYLIKREVSEHELWEDELPRGLVAVVCIRGRLVTVTRA